MSLTGDIIRLTTLEGGGGGGIIRLATLGGGIIRLATNCLRVYEHTNLFVCPGKYLRNLLSCSERYLMVSGETYNMSINITSSLHHQLTVHFVRGVYDGVGCMSVAEEITTILLTIQSPLRPAERKEPTWL